MTLRSVRDAYSAMSSRYIDLFGGDCQPDEKDVAFVRRHLGGLRGPVLDLGCGPGQWSAYLHSLGVDVTGVDMVPEFIAHARRARPGPKYRLGSITTVDAPAGGAAGILAWYSTIHFAPQELVRLLDEFRRVLAPDGVLVVGFFDSDDGISAFGHAVAPAYRWPADVLAEHVARAGFVEVDRLRQQVAERPDRVYGALAARAG